LWGLISTFVGYSALKAGREYDEGASQGSGSEMQASPKAASATEDSAT
jgi:hypothetical protein